MKTTKRIVALVMALIMCLGLLSTASAAASDVQVVEQGGSVYYDSEGNRYTSGTLGENDLVVEMSKTVAGTEVENEFEVTLQVKTNQKLTEIATSTPDAAVLLILDISNSMDYDHTNTKSRLKAAQEAAGTFIDQFVALEGDGRRMVAVATFGSNAQAVRLGGSQYNPDYWVDARTNAASVKNAINNLSTNGGTNIEGGLMVARNLINHGKTSADDIQGINHIYTILLTDGNPTFYVSSRNSSTTNLSINGSEGGGNETTLNDAQDVGTMAAAIKNINNNSLSKLYSICFGTKTSNGRTIHVWDDKPFGNWSNANPATTTSMTVGQWLTAFSDAAYNAQNGTDGLFDSFNSIIELIKLAAQAWQVDDSMGDRIEYLSAVPVTNKDGNGTINNNVTVDENGDIFWNILASSVDDNITNITTNEDGSMASGVLGYTYKYKVKLDNLGDYVAGTDVPTNTEATLDYMVTDDKGEWIPELLTGTFPVPEVEGLQGSLEFTKTDDQGKALAGAEFTLALKSEGKWTSMTATSDANGKVSFTGIPSGHDFVLTESGTPEGYVSANPIDVSVSFGNTTAKGFEGTASAPTVINIRKVAEVAVTKTFEGLPKELWPAVTVTLSNGTNTYSALLNADNNWTDTIEVAAPGTYTVTESAPEVEKYELTEAICTLADGKITVEIGDKKEVGFTNKYEKIVGDLTISKTNVGNTPAAVQVVITGPENYSNTVTLNAANNWTTTLEDLPVGDYYVVEAEGSANIEGYNVAVTGEGKVTVTNTAVATVALTNNYSQKVGSLTLTKTNVGNTPAEAQLLVTAPDGTTQTVTLNAANGWTTTLNNLPIGFYTVKEVAGSADIDLYNLTVSGEDEVEVIEGATTSITITNTYSQKVGNLTILKTNVGNEPASVVLNVTGPNNYSNQITLNVANSWTTTLENLPIGTYNVKEAEGSADIDLYNLTVTGEGDVTVNEGETASIEITNTYAHKLGTLILIKQNQGNTPAEAKLIVTGPYDFREEVTLNDANEWTAILDDLPIGTYNVKEVEGSATIELYNLTVSGEGEVEVTEGNEVPVTIVNTYSQKVGSLTINKTNDGNTPEEVKLLVTGPNNYSNEITLNAANNWTTTLENLPIGKYNVEEVEGSADIDLYNLTVSGEGEVTVNEGETASTTITNTYTQKVGSLTLNKVNEGNIPEEVKLLVTGPHNFITEVTLNAANGWTETLNDLPIGIYNVKEVEGSADIDLYNLTVSGEGEVTVNEGETASTTITNTYSQKVGSLTVNKTNTGNTPAEVKLTVTGPHNYSNELTLNAANGWTETLTNLPIGTYTVEEVEGSADIDLYNLTVSGEGDVEVAEGETASITITNTYSQKVGNLTLNKTNVGNTPEEVKLLVTGPNNYSNEITLNAANNWTTTLENLPIGEYAVEEVEGSADIDLYNVAVSGEGTVNVAEGATASITITNTYSKKVGSLTINKVNEGNTPAEVKLTVTGPHDYSNEVTLNAANGWTTTLTNLPIGIYVVEEVEGSADIDLYNVTVTGEGRVEVAEGETASTTITNTYSQKVGNLQVSKTNVGNTPAEVKLTVTGPHNYSTEITLNAESNWTATLNNLPIGTYTVKEVEGSAVIDLYNLVVTGEGDVNVEEGKTATISITNTYSQKIGNLTITKTNVGNTPAEARFTVTGPHDYRTEVTLNAANGWTTTLNDLPIGEYTVEEVEGSANIDLYNVTVSGEGTVNVAEGATASITITNTYSQKVGNLTVNKTNVGNTPAEVKLTVTGPHDYSNEITLNAANSWTQTLTNLPIGTYTVEEVEGSADIDLYNVAVTGEGNVTVEEGATASITITNTYSQKVGALTLNKTNVGNTPAEVKLTVTGPHDYSTEVTLNAAGNWTATLNNLPIGVYTVNEVEGSANIDLYNVAVTGEGDVTVNEGATASITITNTYTKKVGSLTLNKSNVGNTPAEVKLTVTGPYDYSNEVTLNAAGNWTATIDNLPIGIYTVKEVEGSAEVDLYNVTVSGEGEVEVTEGATASITITNTYSQKVGHLTINKTNVGNTPEEAKFTVTGPNDYSNEVTLNAANGWTETLTNLPIGTYNVTEDKEAARVAGYTLTVAGDGEVTVAEGETATMAVENTYTADPGKLKLVKVIEADQADPAVEYVKLQVSGNKTNGGVFTDIYTLSAENNWQTIIDIPAGVYTVEEIEQVYADEYYTVTTDWANKTVTVLPGQTTVGESNTTTCTNSYTLGNPATISIPVRKTTARGTIGNVDPYGPNVFKFKLTVADRISPRGDKVNPGEYRVTFNGETITPVHGVYTFELTVHGRGTEEGTLVITGNPADLLNKQFIITELSRTEAGQTLNHHWTYDESSYHVYAFEGEDGYIVNIQREGDEREWDGETAEFINLYDEIVKEPPQTGDNSQLGLWMVLMVLSAGCFVFTMKRRTQN